MKTPNIMNAHGSEPLHNCWHLRFICLHIINIYNKSQKNDSIIKEQTIMWFINNCSCFNVSNSL